jgi:hypothetical protein
MKTKQIAFFMLTVLIAFASWANVGYDWVTLVPSATITSFSAEITVSDNDYFNGSASVDYNYCDQLTGSCPTFNSNGIEMSFSANYGTLQPIGSAFGNDIIVLSDNTSLDFTNPGYLGAVK